MELAKKCNICGALYPHKKNAKNVLCLTHAYSDGSITPYRSWLNCCPDCMNAINEVIDKRKGERKDD